MRHLLLLAIAAGTLGASTAAAQDAGSATIGTGQDQAHGQYLTEGAGRAIYLFTADKQGRQDAAATVSRCEDDCAEVWPPVISSALPSAGGGTKPEMLGLFKRRDGTIQVTYNGWPVYHYSKDAVPGQTSGQGVQDFSGEWYLIAPEGTALKND